MSQFLVICWPLLDEHVKAEFHAVISNASLDAALAAEAPDDGAEHPFVAADDLRAAMCEDGELHRLRTTPVELCADRDVTNPHSISSTDYRPGHRCGVADINIDPEECRWIADRDNIRYVERASPVGGNAVADGWSADRMLDRECLECNAIYIDRLAFRYDLALADRIRRQQWPCLGCRIDGTRRAVRESPGVIRVTVRHDDGGRLQRFDPTQPVSPTVNEDTGIRLSYEQRAVAAMPPRFLLDVAAGAEKGEVHAANSRLIVDRPI